MIMSWLHFVSWTVSAGMLVVGATPASGQSASTGPGQAYPNKPIRIVAPEAGGNGDFNARLIALGLAGSFGQSVIVDNRAGNVLIPVQAVLNASRDGYTLLMLGTNFWIVPLLQKMDYDPVRDFLPITLVSIAPGVLVAHPAVPAKSVRDLIALAKAKPAELNYASSGTGTPQHMAAELFKSMAGVDLVHVPFKGGGPAILALLGGQVQLMFASASSVAPQLKTGKLGALAVTSADPSPLLPGVPTIAASGLPGYVSVSMIAAFAPAQTPLPIVQRLNREMQAVVRYPDFKQKFLDSGVEPVGNSADQLAAVMKSEIGRLGKVIKDAGIRAD